MFEGQETDQIMNTQITGIFRGHTHFSRTRLFKERENVTDYILNNDLRIFTQDYLFVFH